MYAFRCSIIYPNEPVITIVAPLIDAQIVETAVLTMMNHQSLIATKANRIVCAGWMGVVADFSRRVIMWMPYMAGAAHWWGAVYDNRFSGPTIWYSVRNHGLQLLL